MTALEIYQCYERLYKFYNKLTLIYPRLVIKTEDRTDKDLSHAMCWISLDIHSKSNKSAWQYEIFIFSTGIKFRHTCGWWGAVADIEEDDLIENTLIWLEEKSDV